MQALSVFSGLALRNLLNLGSDAVKDLINSAEAWHGNIFALLTVVVSHYGCLLVVNLNAVADNIL